VLVDELGLPDSVLAEDYVVPVRPPA
jgi:hypothetical protein